MTVELASLAELEPALAAEGFFGREDGVVARVFVGYRATDALRRSGAPPPPELMAALIHSADERVPVDDLELGVTWLRHAAHTLLS